MTPEFVAPDVARVVAQKVALLREITDLGGDIVALECRRGRGPELDELWDRLSIVRANVVQELHRLLGTEPARPTLH